jgi:hypothetical protein
MSDPLEKIKSNFENAGKLVSKLAEGGSQEDNSGQGDTLANMAYRTLQKMNHITTSSTPEESNEAGFPRPEGFQPDTEGGDRKVQKLR